MVAPAGRVSPATRARREEQIAGVNHLHLGEIDDGIAARVTATEIVGAHFLAAKDDRKFCENVIRGRPIGVPGVSS